MSTDVDLRELAIDRGGTGGSKLRTRRHVLTRYVLPLSLLLGFLCLLAWALRDLVLPPKPVTVVPVFSTTAEVREAGTPLFNAAGWIEPRPTPVRVAALAPGVVEKLLVVEDQPVKAGEPVAELVKDDARLIHDRALADLELREAELDEAEAALTAATTRLKQPVHLEAALGEAEAALAKIETELKNLPFVLRRAKSDHEAMQKDYDGKKAAEGVVAGIKIAIAKSKADSARALAEELRDRDESLKKEQTALTQRRDALKTQLELLADETKARDEALARVRASKARVGRARVVVAEARLQLDRMTIVSPIDGRVFRLIAHPGARIGSNGGMTQMTGHDGSTVVTLYRPTMLQVRVDVRFQDLPQVSLYQPVKINNPALPTPLTGEVLFVSSEADIQKNTLEVKVAIPDPPAVFKPEMLVDVTFLSPEKKDQGQKARGEGPEKVSRIHVLQQLVLTSDDGHFVWIADQSEKVARKQTVTIGALQTNGLVEVTSGLTISSRLITSGTDQLKDGDRISIREEDPTMGTNPSTKSPSP